MLSNFEIHCGLSITGYSGYEIVVGAMFKGGRSASVIGMKSIPRMLILTTGSCQTYDKKKGAGLVQHCKLLL